MNGKKSVKCPNVITTHLTLHQWKSTQYLGWKRVNSFLVLKIVAQFTDYSVLNAVIFVDIFSLAESIVITHNLSIFYNEFKYIVSGTIKIIIFSLSKRV